MFYSIPHGALTLPMLYEKNTYSRLRMKRRAFLYGLEHCHNNGKKNKSESQKFGLMSAFLWNRNIVRRSLKVKVSLNIWSVIRLRVSWEFFFPTRISKRLSCLASGIIGNNWRGGPLMSLFEELDLRPLGHGGKADPTHDRGTQLLAVGILLMRACTNVSSP